MKVAQVYDRHFYEVQQQSENGKWYRMVSSDLIENGNEKEMLADVIEAARKQIGWSRGLEGFLPSELLRVGKLRLVRVHRHCEVLDLDVKKTLASTRIASKKV